MKDKWYLKPEMIVGLSALLVSLVAVLVAVYSAYIDRAYARASVWPRLTISKSDYVTGEQHNYEYGVVNSGTGPAIIKYAYVSVNNQYYRYWQELFEANGVTPTRTMQSFLSTRVIPANQTIVPQKTQNPELIEVWKSLDENINIELCYCSIYDECWVVDRLNQPVEVAECVAEPEKAFRQ